jgi:hypothetical protein
VRLRLGARLVVAFAAAALDAPSVGQTLHPQPAEVAWTEPKLRAGSKPQSLSSPSDIKRRYEHAWDLVQSCDYSGALAEFVWLWDATADTSNEASLYRSHVIESIGRLAPFHEPTHQMFVAVLDELEAFIRKESSPRSYREWDDWAELSRALAQEERLIRLYEERRQPDGSVNSSAIHFYALQSIRDVLLKRGRFADVGRFDADIVEKAMSELELTDLMVALDPDTFSKQDIEASRHDDRQKVALLYAVGLAAGRTAESQQIAALLLAKYDSVDSRRELVLACLRVGVTPDTVPRWIAELRDRGEDVTDLTTALMDAKYK